MMYQPVPAETHRPSKGHNITIPFIITIVSMYVVYVGPYLISRSEIQPACAYVDTVLAIVDIRWILLTFLLSTKLLFTCTYTWYRILVYISLLFILFCICTLMVGCQVPEWYVVEYDWEIGVLILLVAGISTASNRWLLIFLVLAGQFQWFPSTRRTPDVDRWTKVFMTASQLPLIVVVFRWRNNLAYIIPCAVMTVGMLACIYANDRALLAEAESYTMYAVLAIRCVSALIYINHLITTIDVDIESMFFVLVVVFVPLILTKLPRWCAEQCKCKRLCCAR
jgi:hypothetical protein